MIAIDVQGLTSADKYALLECLQSRGWYSCDLSRYFSHPFWLINQYQVIFSMDTTPFGGEPLNTYHPMDLIQLEVNIPSRLFTDAEVQSQLPF